MHRKLKNYAFNLNYASKMEELYFRVMHQKLKNYALEMEEL